jgi:hypothetical protein
MTMPFWCCPNRAASSERIACLVTRYGVQSRRLGSGLLISNYEPRFPIAAAKAPRTDQKLLMIDVRYPTHVQGSGRKLTRGQRENFYGFFEKATLH